MLLQVGLSFTISGGSSAMTAYLDIARNSVVFDTISLGGASVGDLIRVLAGMFTYQVSASGNQHLRTAHPLDRFRQPDMHLHRFVIDRCDLQPLNAARNGGFVFEEMKLWHFNRSTSAQ